MDEPTRKLAAESDPVLRAATDWALELDSSELTIERTAEWQRWLNEDPRHARAFERVEKLLSRVEQIHSPPWPTQAQLEADDYDGSIPVGARRRRSRPRPFSSTTSAWALALAASIVLLLAGMFVLGYPRSIHLPGMLAIDRVATPAGGTQRIVLTDGSAVEVSGKSTLRATFTPGARRITLESGEAFFRVAKDSTRPFTVFAGTTTIRALGTAFNVRRAGDRIVVAVAEGTVWISSPDGTRKVRTAELDAGQQTIARPSDAPLEKVAIDTRSVAGWRNGRLQYLDEPLASVAEDVGRYTARDIEITDPALRDLRVTSTVLESNIDSWLHSLEAIFPVSVQRHVDGSVTISPRPATAQ